MQFHKKKKKDEEQVTIFLLNHRIEKRIMIRKLSIYMFLMSLGKCELYIIKEMLVCNITYEL